jgi:hypothetical protein
MDKKLLILKRMKVWKDCLIPDETLVRFERAVENRE